MAQLGTLTGSDSIVGPDRQREKSALFDLLRSTLRALDTFVESPQDEHTIRNLKQVLLLAIGELERPRNPAENARTAVRSTLPLLSKRPEFPSVQWSQDLIGFGGNIVPQIPTTDRREQPERTKANGDSNQWHCDSFISACAPH